MKKVFIIHGWSYTKDAWSVCTEKLRAAGLEPVMLSVPGLSEVSDEVWTLEKYVNWLSEKLANEQEVILVGHSNGGRIAIAYAAAHHGKLEKLILVDAAGIVHNELPLRMKRAVFGFIAKAGKIFAGIPYARKIFYRLIGARDYEQAPVNMRKTMKNLISVDLTDRLSQITVPTLIVWGEMDTATPASDAYVMHKHIAASELTTIPDAAHSPHKTHPDIVADEIARFAAK